MENKENFTEILKDLIININLNQSQFANKIGLKQSQVSEWLSEKSKLGYDNLKLIYTTFGISADRLSGLE